MILQNLGRVAPRDRGGAFDESPVIAEQLATIAPAIEWRLRLRSAL
jgi:hypothetical protein